MSYISAEELLAKPATTVGAYRQVELSDNGNWGSVAVFEPVKYQNCVVL